MVAASETDTVLMLRKLHNTARVFRNKVGERVFHKRIPARG